MNKMLKREEKQYIKKYNNKEIKCWNKKKNLKLKEDNNWNRNYNNCNSINNK